MYRLRSHLACVCDRNPNIGLPLLSQALRGFNIQIGLWKVVIGFRKVQYRVFNIRIKLQNVRYRVFNIRIGYRDLLVETDSQFQLYLAVAGGTYKSNFQRKLVQMIVRRNQPIVFDPTNQVIKQWIE